MYGDYLLWCYNILHGNVALDCTKFFFHYLPINVLEDIFIRSINNHAHLMCLCIVLLTE